MSEFENAMKQKFKNVILGYIFIDKDERHIKITENKSLKIDNPSCSTTRDTLEEKTWYGCGEFEVQNTLININHLINKLSWRSSSQFHSGEKVNGKTKKTELFSICLQLIAQLEPKEKLIEAKNDYIVNLERQVEEERFFKDKALIRENELQKKINSLETSISELHTENHSLLAKLDEANRALDNAGMFFVAQARGFEWL